MLKYRGSHLIRPGLIGVVVVVLIITVGLNPERLEAWASSVRYQAMFVEAGGLSEGADVTLSGTTVGTVSRVTLTRGVAEVTMNVDATVQMGDQTTAHIRTGTLLGERVVTLESEGAQALRPNAVIPASRTSSPYSLTAAVDQFTANTAATDTLAGFHASYSLRFLPPHTDGTYLSTPPRVKILSTLAHEGELCANTFVDGHAAALFALERSERDTLALERITHVIKADPYSEPISFNRSILDHDGDGRVHIAWNAHEPRSSASSGARGARAKMATWINDPANAYSEVLSPGTVAIMDNWRVLHGREAVKGKWREMGGADVSDRTLRARWRALRAGSGS